MRVIEWEIKVTKFCNLRCTYCYEFDELSDKRRISLDGWRAILTSARWYQEHIQQRYPEQEITTRFVWHGGEPSMLPLSYYESVLALQREVLGAENINTIYHNHVPTNLYAVPPRILAFWKENQFSVAVSFDVISGVRVTTSGQTSEARVEENLKRLLGDGWTAGLNVVLAAHNAPSVNEVYDRLRDLALYCGGRLYLNFIPLHSTPTDNGATPFSLEAPSIVDALSKLFEHWLDDPHAVGVTPLQEYYLAVVRKMLEMPKHYFDRRRFGESSLMVNTDGYVYIFSDAYQKEKSLGCLFEEEFEQIMQSRAYSESLDREEALAARLCNGCPYDGYCNHEPLANGHRDESGERCAIGFNLHQRIESILAERGITAEYLRSEASPEVPNLSFITKPATPASGDHDARRA